MKGLLALQRAKLGVVQGLALCALYDVPGQTPKDIKNILDLSINRSSNLLVQLLVQEYVSVEHRKHPNNRSVHPHYSITPKGQAIAEQFS